MSDDSHSAIRVAPLLMILVVCCFQISMGDVRADDVLRFVEEYPKRPPVTLKKIRALTGVEYGTAEGPSGSTAPHGSFPGHENSGIVKSRQFPDLYWLHNDSGDEPRVYPIHGDGTDYKSARSSDRMGVLLGAAINVDWEDITVNESGQLIVCDLGNNRNDRRDLVIYLVPEPAPLAARAAWMTRYFVRYPDQTAIPAPETDFNFDCEGVFTIGDHIHLFSKNRSNSLTTLYRLDNPSPVQTNTLTELETLDLGGQVTGADASADGMKLVVITYESIWVFERSSKDESFFGGHIRWAPFEAEQVESVCFADEDTLKLIDEATGILYEVEISELTLLK